MTYYLLCIFILIMEIMLDKKQIQAIFLFEFKWVVAAETTTTIWLGPEP